MNQEYYIYKVPQYLKFYVYYITFFQCYSNVLCVFFSYGLVRMRNTQMREGKLQSHYRFENIILKL